MTYDLVIRGGNVADGRGGELYEADIAVTDGKIVLEDRGGGLRHRFRARGNRRKRTLGHAGIRRYPFPLRRPGDLGRPPPVIGLARRHHHVDGQLRRRIRAGEARGPRSSGGADGRGGGDPRRRPARRPHLGMELFPRIPRCPGTPAPRHGCLRLSASFGVACLRHGPTRGQARDRDRRRYRRNAAIGARGHAGRRHGVFLFQDSEPSDLRRRTDPVPGRRRS